MFNFFKKSNSASSFSFLETDMHSHLIPGIDDGAPDLKTSLSLIRQLKDLGFKKLITTPHINVEYYPNTKEQILKGLAEVKEAIKENDIDIEIEAGAEYFMDDHFEELLKKNDLLVFQEKYILVEMSFFGAPPKLEEYLFKIQTKGYKPILAHPERYTYFANEMHRFHRLKQTGCLFQVNLLSLNNHYGSQVKKLAVKLLSKGWVEFLGTDLHHEGHIKELQNFSKNKRRVNKLKSNPKFKNTELSIAINDPKSTT